MTAEWTLVWVWYVDKQTYMAGFAQTNMLTGEEDNGCRIHYTTFAGAMFQIE